MTARTRTIDFGRTRVRIALFGMIILLSFVQAKVGTAVNAYYGLDGGIDTLVSALIGGTFGLAGVGALLLLFGRRVPSDDLPIAAPHT